MKIILVLLLIVSVQNIFGQEKPDYICSDCSSLAQPISVPKPEYPKEAQNSETSGRVKVQVSIDENGNVTEAKMLEGDKVFEENAVKAAMLAKFKPSKYFANGQNVKSFGVLIYNFSPRKRDLIITVEFPQKIILSIPKPEYPESAMFVNASGEVSVEVIIDEAGNVESAKTVSGHPLLRPASEEAALKAKFKPTTLSGKPVKARTYIVYKYVKDRFIESEVTGREVITGEAISLPKPPFPSFSGRTGSKPQVFVQIEIDKNGNVTAANAISGHPVLRAACERAARHSKFTPTKVSGIPVTAKAVLVYEFVLGDEVTVNVEVRSIKAVTSN